MVSWTLPCNLDVGIPANPRLANEGLACYFLRLFNEGIQANIGPKGDTGDPGASGQNAYAITTTAISVPTLASPNIQFTIIPTDILSSGQVIFIAGAGWFTIQNVFQNETVFATLLELIPSPLATVSPGTLVIPTGPKGLTVVGDKGATGPQGLKGDTGLQGVKGNTGPTGPTGPQGATATSTYYELLGSTGSADYNTTNSYADVVFGTLNPFGIDLTPGTYAVSALLQASAATSYAKDFYAKFTIRAGSPAVDTDVANSEQRVYTNVVQPIYLTKIITLAAAGKLLIKAYSQNTTGTPAPFLARLNSKIVIIKLA